MTHTYFAVLVCGALVSSAATLSGQESARHGPPQVVTTGQGEVRITPDRATVVLGVQTRATTAEEATTQNSRRQRAVIDAVKARGIPSEQITTSSFNVIPETRYDREGQAAPKTTSYLVINSISVEVRRIDQVGRIIDAALGAGANQVTSLSFGISSPDSARRAALASAVTKSRADAEVMAGAAGGTLGPLIELTAAETFMPPPRPMMAVARMDAAQEVNVPIEPGQEAIRATVTARWQFIPGGR